MRLSVAAGIDPYRKASCSGDENTFGNTGVFVSTPTLLQSKSRESSLLNAEEANLGIGDEELSKLSPSETRQLFANSQTGDHAYMLGNSPKTQFSADKLNAEVRIENAKQLRAFMSREKNQEIKAKCFLFGLCFPQRVRKSSESGTLKNINTGLLSSTDL